MWDLFIAYLLNASETIKFVLEKDEVFFDCNDRDKLEPLYFLMEGDNWLVMDPKDFSYVKSSTKKMGCALAFESYNYAYFTLGTSFFRGYYVIHDMKEAKMGFVPHVDSRKNLQGGVDDEFF